MYEIRFTEFSKKQFLDLPKDVQKRVDAVLRRIIIRPEHFVKKIVGETCYRLRVGDYRILLDIQHDKSIILVLKIGHRKNIYRNM